MGCCGDTVGKIIHGAAGLARAATGIDAVPLTVLMQRRDVCRGCEYATRNPAPRYAVNKGLTSLSRCTRCHCFIAAKTQIGSEFCPLGLWKAFPGISE
jgi:hypothetical protein